MNVIGCDPGAHGAFVLFVNGRLVDMKDMPCIQVARGPAKKKVSEDGFITAQQGYSSKVPAGAVTAILKEWATAFGPCHVFLEKVGARPGQGGVGMFNFGRTVGQIEEAVAVCGMPLDEVHPHVWKKAMGCTADKGKSRIRASQLLPEAAGYFARVKDNDRAEGALIGLYGVRALSQDLAA